MQQVAGGVTTHYALDLNNDLAQVLASSGTGDPSGSIYLYGLGRIA